jgi:phospholipid/cholesterol/gamma-HCH transport system permease protein
MLQFLYLLSEIVYQGVVTPFKGVKPRGKIFVDQIGRLGAGSAPIVWLVALLVGLTTAFQSAYELRQFGANIYVADLVAISMLRELGPLMAAILVAGRSGAAITAEVGTMRVTEELDAMKLIGINPIQYLAVPRVYAVVITQAMLGVTSAVVGIVGGLIIAVYYLDLSVTSFVVEAVGSLTVDDLLHNLSKSMVFGVIIVVVGVFFGLRVKGGAEGVGRATTHSVVASIFLIIVADCAFSFA